MTNPTYLFYDLETTGFSHAFDQILQFAAIRTDTDLKELERHKIHIRLRPDVVPSATAALTTRITVSEATTAPGLRDEHDAIKEIHHLFNTPNTLSIGYNSLTYDDMMLRFAFYRNLLPPYTHQWAHGCKRADLYPMTIAFWLLKTNSLGITWPQIDGITSLKLANLQAANNLSSGTAHDALVDTEVALALARIFHEKEPTMWRDLLTRFERETDNRKLNELPKLNTSHPYGMMIQGKFGYDKNCIAPALLIINPIPNSRNSLWLRLDEDIPELQKGEAELNVAEMWKHFVRRESGLHQLIVPVESLRSKLTKDRQENMDRNLTLLSQHSQILQKITTSYQPPTYSDRDLDVYADLYPGRFPSNSEASCNRSFVQAPADQKAQHLARLSSKYRELAVRILGNHYPAYLPPAYQPEYQEYIDRIRNNEKFESYTSGDSQAPTTPAQALIDINEKLDSASLSDHTLLKEWADYITTHFK